MPKVDGWDLWTHLCFENRFGVLIRKVNWRTCIGASFCLCLRFQWRKMVLSSKEEDLSVISIDLFSFSSPFVTDWLTDSLIDTFEKHYQKHSERLVTLETCDQSERHDQTNFRFSENSDFWNLFRTLSDFWNIFRFLENFLIFGTNYKLCTCKITLGLCRNTLCIKKTHCIDYTHFTLYIV